MTKLLVTGGAGFIGANFIYYQLARYPEDQIVCLDSLTYAGNIRTLRGAMEYPNMRFVKGDTTDRGAVFSLFEAYRPDIVVNFAAESHVDRSLADPGVFLRTNILGTQNLMDACIRWGTSRFHQVSTDEVYGDLPLDRRDLFFSETDPLRPSSPYSASKASADLLVQAYGRTFRLPATISRCSNNYGPCQFPEKLIPLMIIKALGDQPLPVYGTGENIRDWLYVEDHCDAIDRIIRHGSSWEIYHIGGHSEHSNLNVVKMILQMLGKPESLITFVSDRPGHDLRYAMDTKKIYRELGWRPTADFEHGLCRTIRWYLDHQSWWQDILSGSYREENERAGLELSTVRPLIAPVEGFVSEGVAPETEIS